MATDVGRGIIAPDNNDNIGTGASEMRTLGATAAAAINDVDARKVSIVDATQYGIAGPRGPEGPPGEGDPGPPGPGGSIALEETDPGCFVDSEITWIQWDNSVGTVARAWNPNTQTYHVIHYESGLRDISSLLENPEEWGLVGNITLVRHSATQVEVNITNLRHAEGNTSSWMRVVQLPSGFRPTTTLYSRSRLNASFRVFSSGWVEVYNPSSSLDFFTINFGTQDPVPDALPGS